MSDATRRRKSDFLLKDKIILVTGGNGGIGTATSHCLLNAGATVISASNEGNSEVDSNQKFEKFYYQYVNVRDEKSVLDLFTWIDFTFGRIDILVNCAGVGIFKTLINLTLGEWNTVVETNLTGTFLCMREAMSRMSLKQGGRIINIGSISDHIGIPMNGAYGASKFGVRCLTQIANEEGKGKGIHASLLSLGAVSTRIWADREEFDKNDMLRPEDVAATILYIAASPLGVRLDEVKMFPAKGML